MRLAPGEWRSGDIPWLIDAVGPPQALPPLMKQLAGTVFKDKPARVRMAGPEGIFTGLLAADGNVALDNQGGVQ